MTTTKAVNYTPEQTTELVARYQAGELVEALATSLNRSTRSIVAKLSREKVYVPKTQAQTTVKLKKADLIAHLEKKAQAMPGSFNSLDKATFEVLSALCDL